MDLYATGDGPELQDTGYAIVFGCIVALGLPLNAVSLWILLRHHSLESPSSIFMVNLAISDLLLITSLPMRVYFFATGSWPLGNEACTAITMFFRNNIRSSCVFITFISVDRLLAVVYPLKLRHLRSISNAWRACCFVWFFIVVVNIPEGVTFAIGLQTCNVTFPVCFVTPLGCQLNSQAISFLQSSLVFTMLVINVVSTILVSWTLRRHLSDTVKIKNKMNVMVIFAMNLLMVIICFLPFSVATILQSTSAIMPTECLASVNCCLDPLLYYFSLDAFWKKKEDRELSHGREDQVRSMDLESSSRIH